MLTHEEFKKKEQEKNMLYDTIIGALNRIAVSNNEQEVEMHMKNLDGYIQKYHNVAREVYYHITFLFQDGRK